VDDETNALYDRIMILEVTRQFKPEEGEKHFGRNKTPVEYLRDKKEFPGILNWAHDGFVSVMENSGQFTTPPSVKTAGDSMRIDNDPVFAFLNSCTEPADGVMNCSGVLAAACEKFTQIRFGGSKGTTFTKLKNSLSRNIKADYPTATVEETSHNRRKQFVVKGLALNSEGRAMFAKALEDDPTLTETMVVGKMNEAFG